MLTKIYSVFPACGKTYLYEHQNELGLKILDSDSSYFSHIWEVPDDDERGMLSPNAKKTNLRNPSFPENYIDHIKCKIGKYDYIFVSSHESVRKALNDANIDFTIVHPHEYLLTEWIGRCYLRELQGNNGFPIKVLIDNWDKWINECYDEGNNHNEIVLHHNEYLSDYIKPSIDFCDKK